MTERPRSDSWSPTLLGHSPAPGCGQRHLGPQPDGCGPKGALVAAQQLAHTGIQTDPRPYAHTGIQADPRPYAHTGIQAGIRGRPGRRQRSPPAWLRHRCNLRFGDRAVPAFSGIDRDSMVFRDRGSVKGRAADRSRGPREATPPPWNSGTCCRPGLADSINISCETYLQTRPGATGATRANAILAVDALLGKRHGAV